MARVTRAALLGIVLLCCPLSPAFDYPRIVNIWGNYESNLGLDFYARYELFVAYYHEPFTPAQLAGLRARNPKLKILLTSNLTYGSPWMEEWMQALPGDPAWNYLMRDRFGRVLMLSYWNHPMYNLLAPGFQTVLLDRIDAQFAAARGTYDGIFFDRVHDSISWLGPVDADQDGITDNANALNAAYSLAVRDTLAALRARHPDWLIVGNDAGFAHVGDLMHGREYEYQLRQVLDAGASWPALVAQYHEWSLGSLQPAYTWLASNPHINFRDKYNLNVVRDMPQAMKDECRDSFARVRFGLCSALLSDGLFCYEFGDTWHGNPWWYDEFDNAGAGTGYLGRPTTPAFQQAHTILSTNAFVPGGAPGFNNVMRRNFDHGVVLCNSTLERVRVQLEQPFARINGQQAPLEKLILDDITLNFNAPPPWTRTAAGNHGWNDYLWRAPAGTGQHLARWTFTTRTGGDFVFYAWRTAAADRSNAVPYTVVTSGGAQTTHVNFRTGATGWVSLGVFAVTAGEPLEVRVADAPGGYAVADAVKVESVARYNDGATVTSVELDARDGVILLGAAPTWTPTPTLTPTRTPALEEVLNPGFETGDRFGWLPAQQTRSNVARAEFGVVPDGGEYMFGWSANWDGPWRDEPYQSVPVVPGRRYRVGARVYTHSVQGGFDNCRVRIHADNATGPWLSTDAEWAGAAVDTTATTAQLTIRIEMDQQRASMWNHVYIDNITLEPLDPDAPTATPYATRTRTPTLTPTPTPYRGAIELR